MFSLPYVLQSWGAVATWTGDNERPRGLISEGSRSSEISDVSKSGLRKAKSHQEMGGLSWHAEVENRMDNYLSNDKFVFFNTHIHIYIWPNLFRIGLRTLMAKMCLDHLLLFETTLPISFSQVLFSGGIILYCKKNSKNWVKLKCARFPKSTNQFQNDDGHPFTLSNAKIWAPKFGNLVGDNPANRLV